MSVIGWDLSKWLASKLHWKDQQEQYEEGLDGFDKVVDWNFTQAVKMIQTLAGDHSARQGGYQVYCEESLGTKSRSWSNGDARARRGCQLSGKAQASDLQHYSLTSRQESWQSVSFICELRHVKVSIFFHYVCCLEISCYPGGPSCVGDCSQLNSGGSNNDSRSTVQGKLLFSIHLNLMLRCCFSKQIPI